MVNEWKGFVTVTTITFCFLGNLSGDPERADRARVAAILFGQYSTVAYTDTDLVPEFYNDMPRKAATRATTRLPPSLRLPFVQLIGGLKVIGRNALTNLERSVGSVLVGAKDFVAPEGLGMVSSHDCYVGILKKGIQTNIDSDFGAADYESIDGIRVWKWSVPPYEGYPRSTTFYAALVTNSYFVMSNDRSDFQRTSRALARAKRRSEMRINVARWESFSRYKYWAYRRIRQHEGDNNDSDTTGLAELMPTATALTFFVDMEKKYSSIQVDSPDQNVNTIPKGLPASERLTFKAVEAGIWEATVPLSTDPATTTTLFRIFQLFGFGVVL